MKTTKTLRFMMIAGFIVVPYLLGFIFDMYADPFMGERMPIPLMWLMGVMIIVAPIGIFLLLQLAFRFIIKGTIE